MQMLCGNDDAVSLSDDDDVSLSLGESRAPDSWTRSAPTTVEERLNQCVSIISIRFL